MQTEGGNISLEAWAELLNQKPGDERSNSMDNFGLFLSE